jgi:hypothetical protein
MANAVAPNYNCNNNIPVALWQLTRQMIAAGWTHVASSLATTLSIVIGTDLWNTDKTTWATSVVTGNWWLGQGPVTWRIPFITAITGVFIRGETVTQATSGATGELIGQVWNGSTAGYAVIMPMTGTFNNTDVITGNSSGAYFTPNGTIATFVRQIVFWLDVVTGTDQTTTTFHVYYQCTDSVGEASSQFSYSTRLAAVSATVCPGGATSGANAFPSSTSGSYVAYGTGGSGAASTGSTVLGYYGTCGLAQIMVANATPGAGLSADGSFVFAVGSPSVNAGAYCGFAFQRLDNTEPGDVENYTWLCGGLVGTLNRTTSFYDYSPQLGSSDTFGGSFSSPVIGTIMYSSQPTWRRRGMASPYGGEGTWVLIKPCKLYFCVNAIAASVVMATEAGDNERMSTALITTQVREPLWIIGTSLNLKVRKGTPRWIYQVQGNNGCDTYDTKSWIQLSNSNQSALVAGPWDGVTTPQNA